MMLGKVGRVLLTFFVLGTIMTAPGTAWADEAINPTTGVQVQNLDAANTDVNIRAVNKQGTTVNGAGAGFNDVIPANSSKTYFPLDQLGVTTGFDGSLVVSSAKPVAAIANLLAKSTTGINTSASYGGVSNAATPLTLPLIMKNNGANKFDTVFNVQNAGTTDTTVTVTYVPADATTGNTGCQQTATIKPGAAATFDQGKDSNYTGCAQANGLVGDDGKFVGSATVASAGPLVAAALESSRLTLFAYTGFAQGTINPVMPLVNANNNGNVTGIQVANIGNQDTNVTISYTKGSDGTDCTETQTVKAGSSTTFALVAFANSSLGAAENCADGAKFVGSGRVSANTANQPLVAIANQLNNPKGFGAAYSSFDAATATDKVSLPLIVDNNGKFKGFTGYSIANVGAAPVNITCTYATVAGHTPAVSTGTNIAPGSAMVVNNNGQLRKDANTAYVGSATCVATPAGAKIVGVVNQSVALTTAPDGAAAGDKLLVYEGFSKQ